MSTSLYNYTINKSSEEQIAEHLFKVSEQFIPPLNTYVDIPIYSKKIRKYAYTFEVWEKDDLVGMLACYLNNKVTLEGYITNISILKEYKGKGIGSALMSMAIETALELDFNSLKLEVETENQPAISLYKKHGFYLSGRFGSKYEMKNRLNEDDNIIVSICCVTYNHKNFIRDAIEGFLMQKTTFSFEILIHEDASTDGTADIIREYEKRYPDLIFPIYQKENQYSKGISISATYQFPRARGKYIALCEGDDYWTDPLKLQKQVDFLEANEEYGLVHTELDHYYVKTNRYVKNHWKTSGVHNQEGDIYDTLVGGQGSMIYACTCLFRTKFVQYLDTAKFNSYAYGDVPLWLHIASRSKIGFINQSTAVRNVLLKSATQGNSFERDLMIFNSGVDIFNDFNEIRTFSQKSKKVFFENYHTNVANLCYNHRKQFNLFEYHYKKLYNPTPLLKLKRYLFKYKINKTLSRIIIKILRWILKT